MTQLILYASEDGQSRVQLRAHRGTVWLSQRQMAELFDVSSDNIGLHLKNIYADGELQRGATAEESSVVQKEGNRDVRRKIKFYNFDAILSVGYKVNSSRGIQFRIWANKILKEFLLKGYALDKKRLSHQNEQLKELKESVKILDSVLHYKQLSNDESVGLLKIISDYAYALDILDQYDYQILEIKDTSGKEIYQLKYEEAISQIKKAKKAYGNSELFGREKDESFISSISTVYQTFEGVDLYPSIEEKAANLLYFITKNHSFSNGNKRIAAMQFFIFP